MPRVRPRRLDGKVSRGRPLKINRWAEGAAARRFGPLNLELMSYGKELVRREKGSYNSTAPNRRRQERVDDRKTRVPWRVLRRTRFAGFDQFGSVVLHSGHPCVLGCWAQHRNCRQRPYV